MLIESLPEIIKTYLREQERPAMWLADKAGISRGLMHQILNGDHTPTIGTINKIGRVIGFEVALVPKEF